MEILLTGGTGLVGSAVLDRLVRAGHPVTAVVRSEESRAAVEAAGATGLVGDLFDTDWVAEQLARHDGAVHTAAGSDERDPELNDSVVAAVLTAYAGTSKPYVHTGGVWTHGSGADLTEATPSAAPTITAWRVPQEERLLAADVTASVIRPGIVYGHGAGITTMLLGGPRDDAGALRLIGSGDQHWTTVHTDDLADLYVLVLEAAPEGEAYLAVNGQNPTVRELGEAAGGVVVPGSNEEAAERFGPLFAEALLLDQRADGAKARALGWKPASPSLVDLIAAGYLPGA